MATEQMKYPTDEELSAASERLPGDDEAGLGYRAARLYEVRRALAEEVRALLPEYWFDYWYRARRSPGRIESRLAATGYERALAGALAPWPAGTAVGLDVIDPDLYQALVADQIARLEPSEITVRAISYRNPFAETMTAVGAGTEALSKGAGVIETLATLGPRRRIKKAEAQFAESTIADHIEASKLDTELKREALRQARLANDIAEQELMAKRIANAAAIRSLAAVEKQESLAAWLRAAGQLDEADVVQALESGDADALFELATRDPNLTLSEEPDPEPDRQSRQ